jgi:hypothetical protein
VRRWSDGHDAPRRCVVTSPGPSFCLAAGRGAYASIGLAPPKYRVHSDVALSEERTGDSDPTPHLPPGSVPADALSVKESPGGEAGAFKETSLMNLGIKVP